MQSQWTGLACQLVGQTSGFRRLQVLSRAIRSALGGGWQACAHSVLPGPLWGCEAMYLSAAFYRVCRGHRIGAQTIHYLLELTDLLSSLHLPLPPGGWGGRPRGCLNIPEKSRLSWGFSQSDQPSPSVVLSGSLGILTLALIFLTECLGWEVIHKRDLRRSGSVCSRGRGGGRAGGGGILIEVEGLLKEVCARKKV